MTIGRSFTFVSVIETTWRKFEVLLQSLLGKGTFSLTFLRGYLILNCIPFQRNLIKAFLFFTLSVWVKGNLNYDKTLYTESILQISNHWPCVFFNFWIYVLTFYKVIRCLFELAGWLSVKHTCHQARWSTFTAWNPDDHRDSTPASCPLASTLVLWCSSGPTRVNTLNK